MSTAHNLVDLLRDTFQREPDRVACIYLDDGDAESARLTCHAIDRRARAIAASLQAGAAVGDRALLLYPPGSEFISAYIACLYAGVTPVPCYPPARRGADPRLSAIAADAGATWSLTTDRVMASSGAQIAAHPALSHLKWIATTGVDEARADDWRRPEITPDTLALLQYTSGSTSDPRGVMVSHGNLIANLRDMDVGWGHPLDSTVLVTWLPFFHDMGLIYGMLQPLADGFLSVMMPPAAFLQSPLRWLRAISKYRGTHAAAPNFAYDLCASRVTPADLETLDLASWRIALNGAEPVRAETLDRFARAFAPCGFTPRTFSPGFGLAESTLKVAGVSAADVYRVLHVDVEDLGRHRVSIRPAGDQRAAAFVGCGFPVPDTRILIVDPRTRTISAPGTVGEIWVGGRIVAQGYWNNPAATAETFHATLDGDPHHRFLRTGDLGFMDGGELFVTGRVKDLIILHGLNHYPQDIEHTVEQCHPALALAGAAAFSIESAGGERLAVVAEIARTSIRSLAPAEVFESIRTAISDAHGLAAHAIVLLQPKTLLKTSSGKVRRSACRAAFLAGGLQTVAIWQVDEPQVIAAEPGDVVGDEDGIRRWLTHRFATRLGLAVTAVDPRASLSRYGMDSVDAVGLAGELAAWLGRAVSPTLVYDHPSIDALARHLASGQDARSRADVPADGLPFKAGNGAIAVVGLACRFPGARNPEEFWTVLRDGVDAISELAASRWPSGVPAPQEAAHPASRLLGALPDVDQFDPGFFGIAPREADRIDPQQRLLLEVGWEALEDAGMPADALAGSATGVFVGISNSDYARMLIAHGEAGDIYLGTGSALSIAANRLSYLLDLRGPSLAIDTACSSSLVAIALACQSLRRGESGLALAGGVNLVLSPEYTAAFANANMLAADGRCKAFDASADGYVRGEGAGIAILKRLEDAERDGDRILAVVRGVAVNQDGRTTGLTAPNGPAQQAVLTAALRDAGVPPARVSYVEAHGTGTPLGDPIEVNALKAVLLEGRADGEICRIGSVKTNIGHLESAAGVAGFIKTVLALGHRQIPPSLHVRALNPRLEIAGTPLQVATALEPWNGESPRIAGVSSFGFGGTNAHVVLEAYADPRPSSASAPRDHVLTLSARDPEALAALAQRYAALFDDPSAPAFADVCFTSNIGRSGMSKRLSLVASSAADASSLIAAWRRGPDDLAGLPSGAPVAESPVDQARTAPPVVFLFTGQGSQCRGMGADLYRDEPVFRAAIAECDAILRPLLGASLVDLLYGDRPAALDDMRVTQPAIFSLQHALTRVWASWGVRPAAVIGHSLGEFAAAHAAGMLSLHDALSLVATRGRLLQSLASDGAMVATMAGRATVEAAIAPWPADLSIAAVNGDASVVFSGRATAARAVAATLSAQGFKCTVLAIPHASHSPLVDPILDEFGAAAAQAAFTPPSLPFVSNLTGTWKTDAPDAAYWRRHLREAVLFRDGLEMLRGAGHRLFLEVGPHPTLANLGEQFDAGAGGTWIPSLHRDRAARRQMLAALGTLWTRGVAVDWRALDAPRERRKVSLPSYPFRRTRCWIESTSQTSATSRARRVDGAGPLVGRRLQLAAAQTETVFESRVSASSPEWLGQHRAFGVSIAPTAAYIDMALAAAGCVRGAAVEEVALLHPLRLDEDGHVLQTVIAPDGANRWSWRIFSRSERSAVDDEATWTLHATGRVRRPDAAPSAPDWPQSPALTPIETADFYADLAARGIEIGSEYRLLSGIRRADGSAAAMLRLPLGAQPTGSDALDPRLIDAAFQVAAAALPLDDTAVYVQSGVDRVHIGPASSAGGPFACEARLRRHGASTVVDLQVVSPAGELIVRVDGLAFSRTTRDAVAGWSSDRAADALYRIEWIESSRPPRAATGAVRQWLIFADEAGAGGALADVLRTLGDAAAIVRAGTGYGREADGTFRIRPDRGADYERLLDDVARASAAPLAGVLHLWSLDADSSISLAAAEAATAKGAVSATLALQALLSRAAPAARLWIVTRRAQAAIDAPSVSGVLQSPICAIGRNIALEHPDRWAALIDLDDERADLSAARIAEEIRGGGVPAEDQIALRGSRRYAARLLRSTMPEAVTPVVRNDATYVISGGLGALGLALASQLVSRGARHLVLLSRGGASTDHRRQAIAALEAFGVTVDAPAIDVADAAALRRELNRPSRPPIAGVIHAAGDPAQCAMRALTAAGVTEALAAKIGGAIALRDVTRDLPLDFFLSVSSMVSAWGAGQQAHYAAANHFLDALSQHERAAGRPFTTIGLGPLQGGMLPASVAGDMARIGVRSWTMARAAEVVTGLLAAAPAHVVTAAIDWRQFRQVFETRGARPLLERMPGATPATLRTGRGALAERLQGAPAAERERIVRDAVVHEASRALGMDPARWPDLRRGFFDLGMDSLTALELKKRLEHVAGRSLPATLVFDYPTVESLAAALGRTLLPEASSEPVSRSHPNADAAVPPASPGAGLASTLERLERLVDRA